MNETDLQSETAETLNNQEGETQINVRINNLTKIFQEDDGGEVVAVSDMDIDVRHGEFLVFVGPSGCGKTTTLRTIAGLETPTEGYIEIEGEDVTGLEPRERDIAMVFQNYALYPHMSVRENLSYPLRIRNFPDEKIESRVQETAELLEIPELLDRSPSDLSGGQQQRVSLGRAIVREPSVFLMDEPLSNLDQKLRVQMRTELNRLHNKVGKTTIYVTHDQAEAMTLGDRIVVMNDGELQQIDKPQYIYEHPKNKFVAGFIGEPPMNFLDVDLVETENEYRLQRGPIDFGLPDDIQHSLNSYDGMLNEITFGVRPEHLYDAKQQEITSNMSTFEAEVRVVEPLGSDKFLTLTPFEDSDSTISARVSPDRDYNVGETISIALDLKKSHIFDDGTGLNVTQ